MFEKFNQLNDWLKLAIAFVAIALLINIFKFDFDFSIGGVIGLFVDVILFVVLDVFVAAILFGVDVLLMFIGLASHIFAFVGYVLLFAVIAIPLMLFYKYSQFKNNRKNSKLNNAGQ